MNMTENDLLRELAAEYAVGELEPGDVTVGDLVKATGLGTRRCALILAEKVEHGELIRKVVKSENGRRIYAFRKV